MTTLTDKSTISNEAYELLSCFVDGLDDFIYDIAQSIAQKRQGNGGKQIAIETEDAKAAVELLTNAITQAIRAGHLPDEVADEINAMTKCFEAQSKR